MVSSGWQALVAMLVLVVAGCGGLPGQNIAEVTGRVTLEGKPVTGVILPFEPDESGVAPGKKARPVAFGQTDTDGRYRAFRTGNKQFGAAVGLSHVRITEVSSPPEYANTIFMMVLSLC